MRAIGLSLFFFFLFAFSTIIDAQVSVRFDRAYKTKSIYFEAGDELTFRLKGDKEEYTLAISQILPESEVIVFPQLGTVRLADISTLRVNKDRRWARMINAQLYNFAAGWFLFSLVDMAYNGRATWASALGIPAIAAGLGWLIGLLFRPKKYKLGKRHFLRIVNLGSFFKP